ACESGLGDGAPPARDANARPTGRIRPASAAGTAGRRPASWWRRWRGLWELAFGSDRGNRSAGSRPRSPLLTTAGGSGLDAARRDGRRCGLLEVVGVYAW